MILVAGATGLVGGDICRRLLERGEAVRALVRGTSDPARVAALREGGAETALGDLRDPGSLDAACSRMTAVISTVSSIPFSFVAGENDVTTTDTRGQANLIEAARRAGVAHFVYVSFSGQIDLAFPLRDAKRATEARLRASGMTYTILRPSFFMDAWLSPAVGFDPVNAGATIYGKGTHPISWIAAGDVAELAVRSLQVPEARNAVIELGGPEPLTPLDVVEIFEEMGSPRIELQLVPVEELEAQQQGAPDDMGRSFAGLMRCYANGDAILMGETARTFDIELRSVEDYAAEVLGRTPVPVA
jgi:uncharacterized protein YbjT (DUF2867 family)